MDRVKSGITSEVQNLLCLHVREQFFPKPEVWKVVLRELSSASTLTFDVEVNKEFNKKTTWLFQKLPPDSQSRDKFLPCRIPMAKTQIQN